MILRPHSILGSMLVDHFFIFAAKKKDTAPKIELDSWKEWVRNSVLQMTLFVRIWSLVK